MTHASTRTVLALALPFGLAACGLPTTDSDIKFAGVGVNPEEIGAAPAPGGGLIEYAWVEFAGGQLSLAALGLLSFDEAGPGMVGFKPPYAIVNGTGFIFDTDMPSPDAMFGSFASPPAVKGTCHTVYEPQSYLSNVSDVGNAISIENEDGSAGFNINRRPYVMPPIIQDVFPYYSELASWRATPWTHKVPTGQGNTLSDMEEAVLARPNFPFGETLNISFPGGLPPFEATYNSIPVPLAAAGGDTTLQLPEQPQGFMFEWSGPRFDAATRSWSESSDGQRACVRFAQGDAPASPADCTTLPEPPADGSLVGQIYTAPWETADGSLTLKWEPDTDTSDTISISIRFLGQVDETESYFVEDAVFVEADSDLEGDWNDLVDDGLIPQDTEVPLGFRQSLACDPEEDVQWVFSPTYREGADGSLGYIPTLQGDPLHNLVEVTCTLDPAAGEFTITPEMYASAMDFARQYEAGGAMFYVARTQSRDLTVPPVRDYVGQRRDVAPVKVVSKAVQVGRFWYDE